MARTFEEIVADLEEQNARLLRGGWKRACLGAGITIVAVGAAGELIGLLLALGHAVPKLGLAQGARMGWALFYAAHHVGMVFRTGALRLPHRAAEALAWPVGYSVTGTVALAFTGLTAAAIWLLVRAGRAVADEVGGSVPHRAVHGLKVALPYTVVAYAAAWPLHLRLQLPRTSMFTMHPSHVASLFWPLCIASLSGLAGGLSSGREEMWFSEWWESRSWPARFRGAIAGGRTMLLAGLGLSVLGLCGLAVARPGDASAFLHGVFAAGPMAGTGVLLLSIGALPNAAAWLLQPAMGGCVQVGGGAGGSLPPYCFVSYSSLVGHRLPGGLRDQFWGFPALGPGSHAYLAFLAIPVLVVVAGSIRAVRAAGVHTGKEGIAVGAMAGVVFAALLTLVLALVSVTVKMGGPIADVTSNFYRYGPYPAYGFGLALAWGGVGGAVIGGLAGRLRGPPAPGPG